MNKVTDIMSFINKHDVHFIRVSIINILGEKRSVEFPRSSLADILQGKTMCDSSSIAGGDDTSNSDKIIKVDETSAALSNDGTLEFYGSLCNEDGSFLNTDSRYILSEQIKKLNELGYIFNVGVEPEFYLLHKYNFQPIDQNTYFQIEANDISNDIRRKAAEALMKEGYLLGPFHHEVGPGQCEINFSFSDALTTSDRLFRYKEIIKQIAEQNNAIATFLPKPFPNLPGSGMHLNCSLSDSNGKNIFYDENDKNNLSLLAKKFISGILKHIKALCALACTTNNSYKRLHSGLEAPSQIFISSFNRSAALRIPLSDESKTRVELRFVDNTANMYLLCASIIASGIDGFNNAYSLSLPNTSFPHSLSEALTELKKDEYIYENLGKEAIEKYIKLKESENSDEEDFLTDIKKH